MGRSTRNSENLIRADSPGTSSRVNQESQQEENISQQSDPRAATQEEHRPESLAEEYRSSLQQETEEYEVVNQQLERAIHSAVQKLARESKRSLEVPRGFESCAHLERRLALLETELSTLRIDPIPEDEPMLAVSELTSMELACWQIEDTAKQLRAAEEREKERLVDEQDRLEHEKVILQEAQSLNAAFTQQTVEAPVSPGMLMQRTRARMLYLQDQFQILRWGLIDYLDHLAVSLPQIAFQDTMDDPDSFEKDWSLRSYFTRPPRDAQDSPQRRVVDMRRVLETLMNEALLSSALSEPLEREAFSVPVSGENEAGPSDEREQYILQMLERIGLVEKHRGRWKLVTSSNDL
ncbi:hypothetical protein JCM3765_006899 [Sporobolomyces pararoseus]